MYECVSCGMCGHCQDVDDRQKILDELYRICREIDKDEKSLIFKVFDSISDPVLFARQVAELLKGGNNG